MALGKNIKRHREARGWDQKTLSKLSGVPVVTISAMEVRDSKRSDKAVELARAFGISVEDLISSEYSGTTHPGPAPVQALPVAIELDNNPDWPSVRRVSIKAQAGITGFAVESVDDLPPIVFRADWYKAHGYRPERLLALRVSGESMVPSLWPGDLIVVNTDNATPKDGVAALVAYYGEVTVKRLQMDAGQWWLTSDNPDQRRHARKLCDDNTVIIGEVIYKQSERV